MNLRQIEVFRAVFMMRSISGGARQLNVAQPSVSRMMHHLEKQLGYALFELRQGRIFATPQADILFRETSGLFEQVERVATLAQDLRHGLRERLAILSFYSAALEAVPAALHIVAQRFPNASFSVDAKNPNEQIEDIINGQADVGIAGNVPDMPSLKQRFLADDELVAVISSHHKAASQDVVQLVDIAGAQCIAGPQDSPVGRLLRQAFAERELPFETRITAGSPLPIFELVRRFKGVGVIGSMAIRPTDEANGIVVKPLEIQIKYPISAFWNAQAPSNRARDLFVDQLVTQFKNSSVAGKFVKRRRALG